MLPSVEELRKLRRNMGISQKELAAATGVSQSYIARMERGSINPTYEKMRKIHEYLEERSSAAESIETNAGTIMTSQVVFCSPSDPITDAIDLMRGGGFSQLPVITADERIIGTISEESVNNLLIRGTPFESLKNVLVKDVMGPVLPQVDVRSPIPMLFPMLKYYSAVLIIKGGKLVGIITKADILRAVKSYV